LDLVLARSLLSPHWSRRRSAKEYVITGSDVQCLGEWKKVEGHRTRIFNRNRRRLRKAMRILGKGKPGRRYPVGTILELTPPLPAVHFLGEAMVKREKGFHRPPVPVVPQRGEDVRLRLRERARLHPAQPEPELIDRSPAPARRNPGRRSGR
jgi:hypothetical protein